MVEVLGVKAQGCGMRLSARRGCRVCMDPQKGAELPVGELEESFGSAMRSRRRQEVTA